MLIAVYYTDLLATNPNLYLALAPKPKEKTLKELIKNTYKKNKLTRDILATLRE